MRKEYIIKREWTRDADYLACGPKNEYPLLLCNSGVKVFFGRHFHKKTILFTDKNPKQKGWTYITRRRTGITANGRYYSMWPSIMEILPNEFWIKEKEESPCR